MVEKKTAKPNRIGWLVGALLAVGAAVALFFALRTTGKKPVEAPKETTPGVELTLVQGRVTDGTGAPVAGATIKAYRVEAKKPGQAAGGNPLEGIQVLANPSLNAAVPMSISDPQGHFRFWLPGKLQSLRHGAGFAAIASAEGFQPALEMILPEDEDEGAEPGGDGGTRGAGGITPAKEVVFSLVRSSHNHTVRVLAKSTGQPVAGAKVTMVCDQAKGRAAMWEAATESDGSVELLSVPEAEVSCNIAVQHAGLSPSLAAHKSTALPTTIELLGLGRWRGIVKEAGSGAPARGVTLQVRTWDRPEPLSATSDASGRFNLDQLPVGGPLDYVVTADGHTLVGERPVAVIPIDTLVLDQDIVVETSFVVEGVVVDSRGAGVGKASVSASVMSPPTDKPSLNGHSVDAVTAEDGSFRLRGVVPDARWHIHTAHTGFLEDERADQRLSRGDSLRIVLEDGAVAEVRVVFMPGKTPVPGLLVRLRQAGAQAPQAEETSITTNKKGIAQFPRTRPGKYMVQCVRDVADETPIASKDVSLTSGTERIEVGIPAPGELTGRVTTDSRVPPPEGVLLHFRDDQQKHEFQAATKVTSGAYTLSGVPEGRYTVRASVAESAPITRQNVRITSGNRTQLDLDFSGGLVISGVVTSNKQPVEGATVVAYPYPKGDDALEDLNHGPPTGRPMDVIGGKSEADGSFEIRGLSPGSPVRIDVQHPDYAVWTSAKTYSSGPPSGPIRVDLVKKAVLTIKLVRSDQGEIAGVPITITHEEKGAFHAMLTTREDGTVKFPSIPPGRYGYQLLAPGLRGPTSAQEFEGTITFEPGKDKTETIDVTSH